MQWYEQQSRHDIRTLATNVVKLSELLTRKKGSLPLEYLKDNGLREAYISYYLPTNVNKIFTPMHELSLHSAMLLRKEKLRILDLGCGPGTALFGIMNFFSINRRSLQLEYIAVDQLAENLKELNALFPHLYNSTKCMISIRTVRSRIEDIARVLEGRFDIIIFSDVLNELFPKHKEKISLRADLVYDVMSQFQADDGSCILIEPALRETSRELLYVRNEMLTKGFHVYSPCLCIQECPTLLNVKDWCHEDVAWEPTKLVKEINKLVGLRRNSLKFSYLVLRKDRYALRDIWGDNIFRVVSESIVSKGKMEFYMCGHAGRYLVTRLNRDRTLANQAFDCLQRGNIAALVPLVEKKGHFNVSKDTNVYHLLKGVEHI